MREVILASNSKARQDLLKQIGLKFRVVESRVKELRGVTKSCKDLVVKNALKKAKNAAKRFDRGVVIGADTVVLAGERIIGKPRTKSEAFRILKFLSTRPQWVYTGLAVVDIDNNKIYRSYEKTKVYMYRMSDDEIRAYLRRVSSSKMAGSFDIQGLGGVFIERIEGCFYNVVGLPLAKLARMLKRVGIDIFTNEKR